MPPSIFKFSFDFRKCAEIILFNISIASSLRFKAIKVDTFNNDKLRDKIEAACAKQRVQSSVCKTACAKQCVKHKNINIRNLL